MSDVKGKPAKRLRLLTNLTYATVFPDGTASGVRCNVSAVLIEDPRREGEPGYMGGDKAKVRGFGPDGAWPVFDVRLECGADEFEEAPWDSGAVLLGEAGERRIANGDKIRFADGTVVVLWCEDTERPIKVDVWDDLEYPAVWDKLKQRAAEHWGAPNMPVLRWHDADAVRSIVGAAS